MHRYCTNMVCLISVTSIRQDFLSSLFTKYITFYASLHLVADFMFMVLEPCADFHLGLWISANSVGIFNKNKSLRKKTKKVPITGNNFVWVIHLLLAPLNLFNEKWLKTYVFYFPLLCHTNCISVYCRLFITLLACFV